jgi:hypothetical protein
VAVGADRSLPAGSIFCAAVLAVVVRLLACDGAQFPLVRFE